MVQGKPDHILGMIWMVWIQSCPYVLTNTDINMIKMLGTSFCGQEIII